MSKRGTPLFAVGMAMAVIALAASATGARAAGPDDDWEVIEDQSTGRQPAPGPSNHAGAPSPSQQPQSQPPALPQAPNASAQKTFLACGEPAHPAGEPYKSIVATLNHMWGSDAKVYESVAVMSPHASTGGCIFYNTEFMQNLTTSWMGINDPEELTPMLYAICAHELGHIMHGDVTPARANVALETKELEADRFAGYSLWRLNIKRFDATDTEHYYQAVGDDFVGARGSHGTAKQRVAAFQQGWDLARTGGREDSSLRPAGGLDFAN